MILFILVIAVVFIAALIRAQHREMLSAVNPTKLAEFDREKRRSAIAGLIILGPIFLLFLIFAFFATNHPIAGPKTAPSPSPTVLLRGSSDRNSTPVSSAPLSVPVDDAIRTNPLTAFLTPAETDFSWNGWDIKVNQVQFADSLYRWANSKTADSEAVFVILDLTVRNTKDKGTTFIPQNEMKIVAAGKEIDCADLESRGDWYLNNIEPTLSGHRRGYFEVPKALLTNPIRIRFSEFLEKSHDLAVNVAAKPSVVRYSANEEGSALATASNTPASLAREPALIPVTEEQQAEWKRVAEADKKERELLAKQEAERRKAYAAKPEPDSVVGAKPLTQ
jgi:hypothetical protein